MPGAMRKMGVYLGLVEEDDAQGFDGDGYDDRAGARSYGSHARDRWADEDADDYDRAPRSDRYERSAGSESGRGASVAATRPRAGTATMTRDWSHTTASETPFAEASAFGDTAHPRATESAVAPRPATSPGPGQITTLHPRTYNEARQIGEAYRGGTPVIMNLSEMDDADAKRLVDFAAGLTFGLRGRLERVTAKVFLLSPQNVTVTAEDKARIVEGGFFNQS